MNTVIAWLFTFIVAVAPTNRSQHHQEAKETPEEAAARYQFIAADTTTVLWDAANPPLFSGPDGRAKTASVVMSIMQHESSFRKDVDFGMGSGRGDGGHSWCMMQVKIDGERTGTWNKVKNRFKQWNDPEVELVQGWTGPELVQDRKKCIIAGYRVMKTSFSMCRALPPPEWLRAYASGNCDDDGGGAEKSEARMNFGINWFNGHRPAFHDQEILDSIAMDRATRQARDRAELVSATLLSLESTD